MEPTAVFVYDDGPLADYEDLLPVHQRFGQPGCVAVVSGWLGTGPGPVGRLLGRGTAHLDAAHLREFDDAGWEILSHGAAHRPLDATRTTAPVEAGHRVLPVEVDYHARVAGDTLVLGCDRDGAEQRVTVERASRRPWRTALVLQDPIESAVPAGTTVRYSEAVVRRELRGSKEALAACGVDVDAVALPYSRYGPTARRVVPDLYDAVANAAVGGVNAEPSDPYDLRRQYLGRDALTDDALERFLRTVAEEECLALFGGHAHRHVDPERVTDALALAADLGIRVTTLSDAADSL